MNIDEMQAGRELDALIAEKVMGLDAPTKRKPWWGLMGSTGGLSVPHRYSVAISEAWQVVEKLVANGFDVSVWVGRRDDQNFYTCQVDWGIKKMVAVTAYTAPLAICRAALKAVHSVMSSEKS